MAESGYDNSRHPLGISIRSNDEGYSSNKTRHRRWETAEINTALVDVEEDVLYATGCDGCGAPIAYCYCAVLDSYARFGDCWCDVCVAYEIPPAPRVTLLDALKGK